jgi:hypothetical protein
MPALGTTALRHGANFGANFAANYDRVRPRLHNRARDTPRDCPSLSWSSRPVALACSCLLLLPACCWLSSIAATHLGCPWIVSRDALCLAQAWNPTRPACRSHHRYPMRLFRRLLPGNCWPKSFVSPVGLVR